MLVASLPTLIPAQRHVLRELVFHDFVRIDCDTALEPVWKLGLPSNSHLLNYGAGQVGVEAADEQ